MGVGRGRILRRSASFFSSRWLAVSENSSREPASRENYYRKVLVAQAQASYVAGSPVPLPLPQETGLVSLQDASRKLRQRFVNVDAARLEIPYAV